MTAKISKLQSLRSSSPPFGLGAHADRDGVHFSVYSAHAEAMQVCLFDAEGQREIARYDLPDNRDGVWYGLLPEMGAGLVYGYRAFGPYEPQLGQRFNPNKLLLDPYARQLVGELRWHDALYGFNLQSGSLPSGSLLSVDADLSFDRQDSAPHMPKGVVTVPKGIVAAPAGAVGELSFDWGDDHLPRVPWCDTVIYELHVRGFTKLREDLLPQLRGSFAALGQPGTIDYLKNLGVTTIELLPIHAIVQDRILIDNGLRNYWGYNTLSYFAAERAYSSDGSLREIKTAIKRLHAAGIEVILDVVYNHTGEGNELGPTLSLRGLDNASYYRLQENDPRFYVNDTGCGNTLNFAHPRVIQLTLDSLRYWAQEFHVDGFRFDLSATLGRETNGFDPGAGFFDALLQDPLLSRLKLIAEPWDIGPGGFQLGNHPPGFAEWNAAYRDSVRRYWRGDENQRGALAASLQGSAHLFDRQRRQPFASINFVTAHDGFTLQDLVSYNHKHNDANAEDNRDGSDHNDSNNWGIEGPTDDMAILAQRERGKRNLIATLLCSHGTPMLLAGDEIGQTQHGNNNAYCQDNAVSWLDWQLAASERGKTMLDFVKNLLRLRREWPLLQGHYFQHGEIEVAQGLRDVAWFDERGAELTQADWQNPTARLLTLRRSQRDENGAISIVFLLVNSDGDTHVFALPPLPDALSELNPEYRVLVDTGNGCAAGTAVAKEFITEKIEMAAANAIEVAAHALVLIGVTIALPNDSLPNKDSKENAQ